MVQTKLPINDARFWKNRLTSALVQGQIHRSIYDVDLKDWQRTQVVHQKVLSKLLHPYNRTRFLDAGCGYGALLEILPPRVIDYTGLDFSPDLVEEARKRHPKQHFVVGDLRELPYEKRSFDLAVCRSIDGMVKDHLGIGAWREMEAEILRVADRLILLNYSEPEMFYVFDATPDPKEYSRNTLENQGGRLVYRPGQDGSVELYDIYVDEAQRRQGIASHLIQRVISDTYGTVYGFMRANNLPARKLYESLGFEVIAVPKLYRGMYGYLVVKQNFPGEGGANVS